MRFRSELLLEVLLEDSITGTESHFFSTVKDIQARSLGELGTPLIKSSTSDTNADGKIDRLDLHMEVKSLIGRGLKLSESIRNVKVYGTVDYKLRDMVKLEMIGMFHVNVDTPSGASRIQTIGELQLAQASALPVSSTKRSLYDKNPFDDYRHYSMQEVLEFYTARNGMSPTINFYRKNCFQLAAAPGSALWQPKQACDRPRYQSASNLEGQVYPWSPRDPQARLDSVSSYLPSRSLVL